MIVVTVMVLSLFLYSVRTTGYHSKVHFRLPGLRVRLGVGPLASLPAQQGPGSTLFVDETSSGAHPPGTVLHGCDCDCDDHDDTEYGLLRAAARYRIYPCCFTHPLTHSPCHTHSPCSPGGVGMMYSDEHVLTLPISTTFSLMHAFKTQVLPHTVQQWLPAPPDQPLHVNTVANAIVSCAEKSVLVGQQWDDGEVPVGVADGSAGASADSAGAGAAASERGYELLEVPAIQQLAA